MIIPVSLGTMNLEQEIIPAVLIAGQLENLM